MPETIEIFIKVPSLSAGYVCVIYTHTWWGWISAEHNPQPTILDQQCVSW